jgi:hypothetical protein
VGCEGGAIVFLWDVEVRSLLGMRRGDRFLGCGRAIVFRGVGRRSFFYKLL